MRDDLTDEFVHIRSKLLGPAPLPASGQKRSWQPRNPTSANLRKRTSPGPVGMPQMCQQRTWHLGRLCHSPRGRHRQCVAESPQQVSKCQPRSRLYGGDTRTTRVTIFPLWSGFLGHIRSQFQQIRSGARLVSARYNQDPTHLLPDQISRFDRNHMCLARSQCPSCSRTGIHPV